jgi:predicted RNA binding protein YcfA (HicA-like mRNA interferase family)
LARKPTITLREVRGKLRKLGFVKKRSGKHEIWDNGGGYVIPLSHGNQDVGPALLKSICSQLDMSVDEFLDV